MAKITKNQTIKVRAWMNQHAEEYNSATELAEGAAAAQGLTAELSDENSLIWEWAFEIFTDSQKDYPNQLDDVKEQPVTEVTVDTQSEVSVSFVDSTVKNCGMMSVDELKQVVEFCTTRITDLQRNEVEDIEAQMSKLQAKLDALKGVKPAELKEPSKRTSKVVVNPDDPTQVYKFGKTPDWLSALCAKTGKTVSDLRVEV